MRGVSIIGVSVSVCRCVCLGVGLGLATIGCGPSPAMQRAQQPKAPPNAVVVVVDCDDAEADDDDAELASTSTPPRRSVEYVRIDEWQQPSAARDIEARIEPRGNKPPEYVRLPNLTKHRDIAPTTTFRTGRYWW